MSLEGQTDDLAPTGLDGAVALSFDDLCATVYATEESEEVLISKDLLLMQASVCVQKQAM